MTDTDTLERRVKKLEDKVGVAKATRILVVQDKSGSMGSRVEETITGFNEYLEDLQKDDSDEAYLTLIQFNDGYHVIEEAKPVGKVKPLNTTTYRVSGRTALFDAVGKGITDLREELGDDERALVIIMTDGGENASSEYTQSSIAELVKKHEKKDNWTFVFLGAGQSSWSGNAELGLGKGHAVFYGADAASQKFAYASLSANTETLRRSRSMKDENFGEKSGNTLKELGGTVVDANESN